MEDKERRSVDVGREPFVLKLILLQLAGGGVEAEAGACFEGEISGRRLPSVHLVVADAEGLFCGEGAVCDSFEDPDEMIEGPFDDFAAVVGRVRVASDLCEEVEGEAEAPGEVQGSEGRIVVEAIAGAQRHMTAKICDHDASGHGQALLPQFDLTWQLMTVEVEIGGPARQMPVCRVHGRRGQSRERRVPREVLETCFWEAPEDGL